jgi:hypothetical protein
MSFSSRTRHIALIAGSAITASCALAQGTPGLWSRGFLHTPDAATTLTPSGPGRVLASSSGGGNLLPSVQWPFRLGGIVTCDTSNLDAPSPGLPIRSITSTFHDGSTQIGTLIARGKHFTGRPPIQINRTIACDFSSSGAIAVEWRCIDENGIVLAQGITSGPFLECDDLSDYPPSDSSSYGLGSGKATFKEFTVTKKVGSARVYSTTGPVLVADVATISFRPIWCITSPCPGDGLGISNMDITTSNLPQLEMGDAVCSWSWGECNSGNKGVHRLTVHATEGTKITEAPPADLDGDGQLDSVLGAGSVEGIAGGVIAGIVIARPTLAATPPAPGATTGLSFQRKNYVGHVTLIKQRTASGLTTTLTSYTDPLTGLTTLTPDFSALGSTEYEVSGYDANGDLIGTAIACCASGITFIGCPNGTYTSWWNCGPGPNMCPGGCFAFTDIVLPGGNVIPGVSSFRLAPVIGADLFTEATEIEILDQAPADPDGITTPIQIGLIEVLTIAPAACDTIDFNNNGVFPEDQDVVDFFDTLAGGNPATCDAALGCQDIDFNNNGVFPEDQDVVDFFNVLAGGACP